MPADGRRRVETAAFVGTRAALGVWSTSAQRQRAMLVNRGGQRGLTVVN